MDLDLNLDLINNKTSEYKKYGNLRQENNLYCCIVKEGCYF